MKFETVTARINMMAKGTEMVLNSTTRQGVTPAEFKVMQSIHGKDNVQVIEATDVAMELQGYDVKGKPSYTERTHEEELNRLLTWYGPAAVKKVYEGDQPDLHYTFAEARIHTSVPNNVSNLSDSVKDSDEKKNQIAATLSTGKNNK